MKYLEMLGRVSLAMLVASPLAAVIMVILIFAAASDLVWLVTHRDLDNQWNARICDYLDTPDNVYMRFGTWYENVVRRILGLTEV